MEDYRIHVEVVPAYISDQSFPEEGRYCFSYTVTVTNFSHVAVQLISRHWHIVDDQGKIQEVKGLGVVGQQPLLEPYEAFEYTSGVEICAPKGVMKGEFFLVAEDGARFEAEVAAFVLEAGKPLPMPIIRSNAIH